ncbi:sulfatase-like hydrolase/transferase [Halosimplex amylolyticum]|uniref:sulfatase-like hydrolase/transferase n=1 Tax=Halosimplex amylolyticum TaxID=3396616 RepID=UPI003F5466D5
MTNIALVVLDTLRKDAFDDHFDWLPGVHFDNAWSPSAWTTPAHAALFGGTYPSELGVFAKTESLDCDRPVLAESLSGAGYRTRAFSANANIASAFAFDRGFDDFRHSWRGRKHAEDVFDWGDFISETQDQGPSRFLRAVYECVTRDVDTVASLSYGLRMKARDLGIESISGADDGAALALEYVRETEFGDDEFFFANLMEAHGPYDPPAEYRTGEYTASPNIDDTIGDGPEESRETIRGAYDDCVRYLSDVYEDVFAALREDFDYVITLGDHGELFGTDGVWAHNHGIYPGLVHVPLHVYDGEDRTTRSDDLVSLLDVHRTVLDLADVDGRSRGHNLFEELPERDLLVERYGLRTNRIEQMRANGYDEEVIERYDRNLAGVVLSEGGYAYETLDGFDRSGDVDADADVRSRLEATRADIDTAAVDLDQTTVPSDVQDRLRDLGYA